MKKLFVIKDNESTPLRVASSLAKKGVNVAISMMLNSTYLAVPQGEQSAAIHECIESGVRVYILKKDADRRGLTNRLIEGVKLIDHSQLIDLFFSENQTVINL